VTGRVGAVIVLLGLEGDLLRSGYGGLIAGLNLILLGPGLGAARKVAAQTPLVPSGLYGYPSGRASFAITYNSQPIAVPATPIPGAVCANLGLQLVPILGAVRARTPRSGARRPLARRRRVLIP
jgi:hypothetical protein